MRKNKKIVEYMFHQMQPIITVTNAAPVMVLVQKLFMPRMYK